MAYDTKEYILQKAFEVFLTKGFDSTSMTVLQQEFKMSRGAMYRYFASKDELFRAVIDKFFWGLVDFMRPRVEKGAGLPELIEARCQSMENLVMYLNKIEGIDMVFLNYTALIIQAAKHYPGFFEKWEINKVSEVKQWETAVQNSIDKGEVRSDVDVKMMARIFSKALFDDNDTTPMKSFSSVAKLTKKMMNYVYSLIQV